MTTAQQALYHVCAHATKPNHPDLHSIAPLLTLVVYLKITETEP
jgi:hypothetical protein